MCMCTRQVHMYVMYILGLMIYMLDSPDTNIVAAYVQEDTGRFVSCVLKKR